MTTSRSGFDLSPLPPNRIAALAEGFTPEERTVILHQGTERPFCGLFLDNKKKGVYTCRLCGLPLFASNAKFESGTGWPSFTRPVAAENLTTIEDHAYGMVRTEVRCAGCDGHLGHVFPDGPPPTGQRYCMNSVAMRHVPAGEPLEP